jgi:hypothetical protein
MKGLPCFADPDNLRAPEEAQAPLGDTALDLLQAVYRDMQQPLSARMRAAIEALPFESPKLAVIATNSMSGDRFAELLDRAIARSKANYPKQLELKANSADD